jgi:hypothetical protein
VRERVAQLPLGEVNHPPSLLRTPRPNWRGFFCNGATVTNTDRAACVLNSSRNSLRIWRYRSAVAPMPGSRQLPAVRQRTLPQCSDARRVRCRISGIAKPFSPCRDILPMFARPCYRDCYPPAPTPDISLTGARRERYRALLGRGTESRTSPTEPIDGCHKSGVQRTEPIARYCSDRHQGAG